MQALSQLVTRVTAYHPGADVAMIERAYHYAQSAHDGQKRKSGEPYFVHPLSVAGVIAELKLDTASLCAALLHDVVEDTRATVETIRGEFGDEVAFLVDGVTKLSKFNFTSREDRQAESFRKMLLHMARDIRVLLVKLADRLDNMRTLEHMKAESQERIARETIDIYAPLANRLGISWMKSELEDHAFRYLEPEAYASLAEKVAHTQAEQDGYIRRTVQTLSARLNEAGFAAEVSGRAKHLYSIWRKMRGQSCDYEQVYDVIAFRAIVESTAECYAALGVIHGTYTPIPGRFKDYIALPKPNMYQSLHTTVLGPERERMEVQIRTREMHRVAEFGIAAHWKYKERGRGAAALDGDPGILDHKDAQRFHWLRQLMESQRELKDPQEFLESVKVDLFQDEVYVFTPKGDVRVFPRGATPLDFGYAIHSDVGDHAAGARVNGVLVPLRSQLRSGDVVEILTDATRQPSKDWLDYVVTSKAKGRIRSFLRSEQRERSLRLGRELLDRELHKHALSYNKTVKTGAIQRAVEDARAQTVEDLLIQVGYGKYDAAKVVDSLVPPDQRSTPPPELRESIVEKVTRKVTGRDANGILVSGESDVLVRFAKCCSPVPGDEIVGFITRGRGVAVHRRGCDKGLDLDPERRVDVAWSAGAKVSRPVCLRVITANRLGILAEVGNTFSKSGVNIDEANCRAGDDRAVNLFSFSIADLSSLKGVIRSLQKVKGVLSVERV